MERKLALLSLLGLILIVGCSGGDEDPKANLNAPLSKTKATKVQAAADRGETPEEVARMDEPARGKANGAR